MDSNKLLSKEDVLLHSLYEFYQNKSYIDKILPIVTGNSEISLRVLDYFVTNYAKNNNIVLNKTTNYNIYQDYKMLFFFSFYRTWTTYKLQNFHFRELMFLNLEIFFLCTKAIYI